MEPCMSVTRLRTVGWIPWLTIRVMFPREWAINVLSGAKGGTCGINRGVNILILDFHAQPFEFTHKLFLLKVNSSFKESLNWIESYWGLVFCYHCWLNNIADIYSNNINCSYIAISPFLSVLRPKGRPPITLGPKQNNRNSLYHSFQILSWTDSIELDLYTL